MQRGAFAKTPPRGPPSKEPPPSEADLASLLADPTGRSQGNLFEGKSREERKEGLVLDLSVKAS